MARSIWKGPFTDEKLLKKAQQARRSGSRSYITVYSRQSVILPQHVGLNYKVHNGKKFHPFLATENTIGHRFGEFSPTRTFTGHSGNKKASRVKGGK